VITSPDDEPRTFPPSFNFRRFTPEVAHLLRRIDTALVRVETADLWPSSAEALRFSAQVGTIHYSTLIEGNGSVCWKPSALRAASWTPRRRRRSSSSTPSTL
jgi:hypothetical protein